MENKEIISAFSTLARLMELHGENTFKIRSYQNVARQLKKLDTPLSSILPAELEGLPGVGKAISAKIQELLQTGTMAALNKFLDITPPGIVELLSLKGFGPKKIGLLWKEIGVESPGELLYACNENRLVEIKGFGLKTQEDLRKKLEYLIRSKGKFHYARVEEEAEAVLEKLSRAFPDAPLSLCGEIRRKMPVVDRIELLLGDENAGEKVRSLFPEGKEKEKGVNSWNTNGDIPVYLHLCKPQNFGSSLFRLSANTDFLDKFKTTFPSADSLESNTETDVFKQAGIPFIPPELREDGYFLEKANALPILLDPEDIKGIIHAHSTYSDGLHTLREMATYVREQGYAYLGITDHSKSAFYANGLSVERLEKQLEEIQQLNTEMAPFKIFAGIESDILNDGSLDYPDEVLEKLDFVIASVHSNLKMDKEKATQRLLTAIENPYTTMLGHPTGRLLLSREGYPLDHKKVIDACAANGVAIEVNANPYRLDLDWKYIPYALEKGVWLSVNPDAHSQAQIHYVKYGVWAARKGGLSPSQCLNCLNMTDFAAFLLKRKEMATGH